MVREVRERLQRHAFRASVDLPPLMARCGMAVVAFIMSADPAIHPIIPAWPFGVMLVLGLFTRLSTGAVILLAVQAFRPPLTPTNVLLGLTIYAVMRRVRTQGGGPLAIDPLPFRRWFPRADWDRYAVWGQRALRRRAGYYDQYAGFSLRIPLALLLLPVGLTFVLTGTFPVQLLGWMWMVLGLALAVGFLTPWTSLAAALVFPLAVPVTDTWLWFTPMFGALALALIDDDHLSVDRSLRQRGGLFPRVRREVVVEPARRR